MKHLLVCVTVFVLAAQAALRTFDPNSKVNYQAPYGSANWTDPTFWDTGVPVNGDDVVIPSSSYTVSSGDTPFLFDISSATITLNSLNIDDDRVRIYSSTGTGKLIITGSLTWGSSYIAAPLELGQSSVATVKYGAKLESTTLTIRGRFNILDQTLRIISPNVVVNIESTAVVNLTTTYSDVAIGETRTDSGNTIINNKGTVHLVNNLADVSGSYIVALCGKVVNTGTINAVKGAVQIGFCSGTAYNLTLSGNMNIATGAYLILPRGVHTPDATLSLTGTGTLKLQGSYDIPDASVLNLNSALTWNSGTITTELNARFTGDGPLTVGKLDLTCAYFSASSTGVVTTPSFKLSGGTYCSSTYYPNKPQKHILRPIVANNFTITSSLEISGIYGSVTVNGYGLQMGCDITGETFATAGRLTIGAAAEYMAVGCCLDILVYVENFGTFVTSWADRQGNLPTYLGTEMTLGGGGLSRGRWHANGYPVPRLGQMGDIRFTGNGDKGLGWVYQTGTVFTGVGWSRLFNAFSGSSGTVKYANASNHQFDANVVAQNFAVGEICTVSGKGNLTILGTFSTLSTNDIRGKFLGGNIVARKVAFEMAHDWSGPSLDIQETAQMYGGGVALVKASSIITVLPNATAYFISSFSSNTASLGYILVYGTIQIEATYSSLQYIDSGLVPFVIGNQGVLKVNGNVEVSCNNANSASSTQCTCDGAPTRCWAGCVGTNACLSEVVENIKTVKPGAEFNAQGGISFWKGSRLILNMYSDAAIDGTKDSYDANTYNYGGEYVASGTSGDTCAQCRFGGTLEINFVPPFVIGSNDPLPVPEGSKWHFFESWGARCFGAFERVVSTVGLPDGWVLGYKSEQYMWSGSVPYWVTYAIPCSDTNATCKSQYEATAPSLDLVKPANYAAFKAQYFPCTVVTSSTSSSSSTSTDSTGSSTDSTGPSTSTGPGTSTTTSTSTSTSSSTTSCVRITGRTVGFNCSVGNTLQNWFTFVVIFISLCLPLLNQ